MSKMKNAVRYSCRKCDQIRIIVQFASLRVIAVLSFLFIFCTPANFPVVHPVKNDMPNEIAKIKAQEYFIRARDYERRGLQQSAERYYEMAHELDPGSNILQEQLTRMYLENGKYAQALLLIKKNRSNNELSRNEKRSVATIYLKIGEFTKAVELLEGITDKIEEDVYSLGLIYESMGNITKALENYIVYYQKNPDAVQIGFKIGKLFISEKKYSQAESLFQYMKTGNTGIADIYTQLGTVKLFQGDTSEGIFLYDSALHIDSTHEEALRNKAQVYISKNIYSEAVKCYEALYKNSSFGEVYGRTLALLYYYNKQYSSAEELLKVMLQESIDDYELHYYLGLVFSASEKYDHAKIELEKAISIRCEFDDAWRELCLVSIREKEFDDALIIAERYTSAFKESASAWRLKGYVCSLQKEYSIAIDALQHAVAIDTNDSHSWFELGSAFERNGEIEKAADAFRIVLKYRPHDPVTQNYLGYMWAEKGLNLDSALILLKSALGQDSSNGAYLDSYAWIFYQLGEIDSAEINIKKALVQISDDPVIHAHLGDILVKKGELIGAVDAFRKALVLKHENPDVIKSKIEEIELLIRRDHK